LRTKYAYLSGKNRLTCVQAKAISKCTQQYDDRFMRGEGSRQDALDSANSKIRRSIHSGRIANLSKSNKLTLDEAVILKQSLQMILRSGISMSGFEKNSIEIVIMRLSDSHKSRIELSGGRYRLDKLDVRKSDEGYN